MNAVPFDAFHNRVTDTAIRRMLQSALEANANVLRFGANTLTRTHERVSRIYHFLGDERRANGPDRKQSMHVFSYTHSFIVWMDESQMSSLEPDDTASHSLNVFVHACVLAIAM